MVSKAARAASKTRAVKAASSNGRARISRAAAAATPASSSSKTPRRMMIGRRVAEPIGS